MAFPDLQYIDVFCKATVLLDSWARFRSYHSSPSKRFLLRGRNPPHSPGCLCGGPPLGQGACIRSLAAFTCTQDSGPGSVIPKSLCPSLPRLSPVQGKNQGDVMLFFYKATSFQFTGLSFILRFVLCAIKISFLLGIFFFFNVLLCQGGKPTSIMKILCEILLVCEILTPEHHFKPQISDFYLVYIWDYHVILGNSCNLNAHFKNISFIWNIWSRQIHRGRKQIRGCQGRRAGSEARLLQGVKRCGNGERVAARRCEHTLCCWG